MSAQVKEFVRTPLWGTVESGSGSGELTGITADHLIWNGLTLSVELNGTRDANARTFQLTE